MLFNGKGATEKCRDTDEERRDDRQSAVGVNQLYSDDMSSRRVHFPLQPRSDRLFRPHPGPSSTSPPTVWVALMEYISGRDNGGRSIIRTAGRMAAPRQRRPSLDWSNELVVFRGQRGDGRSTLSSARWRIGRRVSAPRSGRAVPRDDQLSPIHGVRPPGRWSASPAEDLAPLGRSHPCLAACHATHACKHSPRTVLAHRPLLNREYSGWLQKASNYMYEESSLNRIENRRWG